MSETLARTCSFLIIFLGLKVGLAYFESIIKGIYYLTHLYPSGVSTLPGVPLCALSYRSALLRTHSRVKVQAMGNHEP